MKTGARGRWRWAAAAGIVAALVLGLGRGRASPEHAFVARPLPRESSDLAVACLASGEVRPPVSELSDADFAAIVEIVGRLIRAYELADFDSFLALRAKDLEFAEREQRHHREELRSLCGQLGLDSARLPGDWTGLLGAYWDAYYSRAPVARFSPETSVIELHSEGLGERAIETWEREFEAVSAGLAGSLIRHRLMMPHRRSIGSVAGGSVDLRWLDLKLGFESHDGGTGRLIARFVWDGSMQEWFLHRADTIHDGEVRDDRRHLVL
jgi:hypothetical protein